MGDAGSLFGTLPAINIIVGEQNSTAGDPDGERHSLTDFGIGFMKVQPYNHDGRNLYNPAENILRGTEMLKDALSQDSRGNANPGTTAAEQMWFAYVAYNTGQYRGNTVADVRANFPTYAARADEFLDHMLVARP